MAEPSFAVDTEGLGVAAEQLANLASALERVRSRLVAALEAQGPPPANEPIGKAYAEQVNKPSKAVPQALAELVRVVNSALERVRTMQTGFTGEELRVLDLVNQSLRPSDLASGPGAGPSSRRG